MNKLLAVAFAATLMGASAAAFSQDMNEGGCMQPQIKAMDVNGDGMISKDEFMKAHEAMFDKISKTQDGVVSVKDMQTQMMQLHMSECGMKGGEMMHGDKMMNMPGHHPG